MRYDAAFLSRFGQWQGAAVGVDDVSIDTRTLPHGALYVALIGERLDGHAFVKDATEAAAVMVSRRVETSLPQLIVSDTLQALQNMAHAHRMRVPARYIGVCGSNGKTTTKEMIASVLGQKGKTHRTTGNLNNHIGLPLSLLRIDTDTQFAVLETGMNHPGELLELAKILEPEIAVLTTIQAEHLEGLGTVENVAKAEGELFSHTTKVAIVPSDEPLVDSHALPKQHTLRVVRFGEKGDVKLISHALTDDGGTLIEYETKLGVVKARLPHLGKHNALNAGAAIAVGIECGLTVEQIKRGLEMTPLVDRRLRIHKTPAHTVLDDCYNANPGSMAAALEVLRVLGKGKRKIALLGDMLELGDAAPREHVELGRLVGKIGVDVLGVFGEFASEVVGAAGVAASRSEKDHEALLTWVKSQVRQGDVILIKGSRGMKMERFVNALVGDSVAGGAH